MSALLTESPFDSTLASVVMLREKGGGYLQGSSPSLELLLPITLGYFAYDLAMMAVRFTAVPLLPPPRQLPCTTPPHPTPT